MELHNAEYVRGVAKSELWRLIIETIDTAMKEGRFKCYVDRKLPNILKEMLLDKGYEVRLCGQGFMISWKEDEDYDE